MAWMRILFPGGRKRAVVQVQPWEGQEVDVDRFWAEAWAELNHRQQDLARNLKLADARWTVDQNAGLIHFDRADGATVTAPVQIIGSWNPNNETFTWGWDHPSVQTRLRANAERTRWFGEKNKLQELTKPSLRASEADAWRLTAVAMKVNGAKGVYRGPTEGPVVFMTLGELKVEKKEA
jgi:hypothetical protein